MSYEMIGRRSKGAGKRTCQMSTSALTDIATRSEGSKDTDAAHKELVRRLKLKGA